MCWLPFLPWLWWMWAGSNWAEVQLNKLWKSFGICVQLCILLWPLKCFEIEVTYYDKRAEQLLIRQLCRWGGSRTQWQDHWRDQSANSWGQGTHHRSLHLSACPSGTSAGFIRCLAETSRTHLLQTKEKAFHVAFPSISCWQPGKAYEPPLSSTVMVSQCISTRYYFEML